MMLDQLNGIDKIECEPMAGGVVRKEFVSH